METYKYTEHQKKLITSSKQHSLKSTPSKLIRFGHRYAVIVLNKNIWKTKVWLCQEGENCSEIAEGHFSKIAETAHRASSTEAAYSEHSIAIHSISMAGIM